MNNLLRDTEYVTLAVQPGDPAELELVAHCPTPAAALRFEQSFRAIVSLAAATNARQPAIAGALQSIRIRRDDRVVHASLSAPLDALAKLALLTLIQLLLEPHRAQPQHRDPVHRHAQPSAATAPSTPAPFRKMPRTISMK